MPLKTMICLILDRSGSMMDVKLDVIGGVNSFIGKQRALPDPACIALVRFDDQAIERFRAMQPLLDVPLLRPEDFEPRGFTPLLDAVGTTIVSLDADWKRENPDRAIVVIATDGKENASKEFSKVKVQQLITAREASKLWSFIYLGANVDAFAEAGALGIRAANAAGYTASSAGVASSYDTVSDAVYKMRASGSTTAHNLGGNIADDGTLHQAPGQQPPGTVQADLVWSPPGSQAQPGQVWMPPPAA
jgi:uncharacterized protein YegL